jgi:hypothetical protein
MAINNKFVTSFSELYLGAPVTAGGITESAVDSWFNAPTTSPVAAASTAVAVGEFCHLASTTGVSDLKVHFKNSTAASISPTAADLTAVGLLGLGFTVEHCKVPLLSEIGSLSNESSVIDVPEFGERFKGKLRGQLDGGQLDATLYWAPREPAHLLIRELASSGAAIAAGIRWLPDDLSTSKGELVVFNSFVSSFGIDTAFDDVAKVSSTLVVDGAESFAEET